MGDKVVFKDEDIRAFSRWQKFCEKLGEQVGERLEIYMKDLIRCWEGGDGNPTITIKWMPRKPGDEFPAATPSLMIPGRKVKDEWVIDANDVRQLDLFRGVKEENF